MELIPQVRDGARQFIERYAASGFRVSGAIYLGPVLVFPDRTEAWAEAAFTIGGLAAVLAHGDVELLLLGFGRRVLPVGAELRGALKARGIAVEPMDTGAACRTYNMLVGEDRRVAAALLPPF
ncbi:MAG: Mth938-like domain-containing protein [Alphaproteobacteria bacterium]